MNAGAIEAVATAVAPCDATETGRLVPVIVSGFELKATRAYSAPVVPPLRQIPVPESPGSTLPAAGEVGAPLEQAVASTEGIDTLVKHATEGFTGKSGVMPPKGGNPALTDEQIKATVTWIVSQVK